MHNYLFDVHVHTREVSPCGVLSAVEIVRMYRQAGYHGIVVTDHYYPGLPSFQESAGWEEAVARYLGGFCRARAEGERIGLTVLWGLELSLRGENPGDFLVYGLEEAFLLEQPHLYRLELEELRHRIRPAGALVYQAHPFRPGMRPAAAALLDGVEVFNGNPRHDSRNHLAARFAERHRLLAVSGSDVHQVDEVGQGGLRLARIPAGNRDLAELLRDPGSYRLVTAGAGGVRVPTPGRGARSGTGRTARSAPPAPESDLLLS
jgi:hypothetical protein